MTASYTRRSPLYARVWRWHFFAGLFVAPFAIVLALSGSLYLFKPQIEAALQARIERGASAGAPQDADRLVAAALEHTHGGRLQTFVLPRAGDRSAQIEIETTSGERRALWVDRGDGRILQDIAAQERPMRVVQKLHGELLNGRWGSALVELAACWMIVLLASGLYLGWPRGRRWTRVLFPSLARGNRRRLRELHGAVGLWLAPLVLLFLVSGLPWTGVWGSAFDQVKKWTGSTGRGEMGRPGGHSDHAQSDGLQLWSRSGEETGVVTVRSAAAANTTTPETRVQIRLQEIAERAEREALPHPVEISPPRGEDGVWTVRSMTQRRPDRVTIHYDRFTGEPRLRLGFADQRPLEQAVSVGIALHEGHLFGALNQALGLLVALAVITLSASGVAMWWRRRPKGALAAPPLPSDLRIGHGVRALAVGLGIFLPLVGASLLVVALADALWGRVAVWRASRMTTHATRIP